MRFVAFVVCIVLTITTCSAAGAGRPKGKNCDLSSPPPNAGEESNHGVTLRVYPRARDIGARYSGCQVLLAPTAEGWSTVSLTEVVSGDPVRVWFPDSSDEAALVCRYRRGKVVQGNPATCPAPEFILVKSLAVGCVSLLKERVAKEGLGAPWPLHCKFE